MNDLLRYSFPFVLANSTPVSTYLRETCAGIFCRVWTAARGTTGRCRVVSQQLGAVWGGAGVSARVPRPQGVLHPHRAGTRLRDGPLQPSAEREPLRARPPESAEPQLRPRAPAGDASGDAGGDASGGGDSGALVARAGTVL